MLCAIVFAIATNWAYAQTTVSRPDGHAPIGVMGDHTHKKGQIMFSYRFMTMKMNESRDGTSDIPADNIATTIANRFSGVTGQPPTLRVVPLDMTMNMHMLGAMYAPSDRLTLMVMGMYLTNTMDHVTYQGGSGTTELGIFTTSSSGIGDTKITALYQLTEKLHVNLGFSIPTGSIEEEDQVLTPMNMQPTLRLPYPMQIGSGTWDLLPTLTYVNRSDKIGWGAQVSSVMRLGENKNDFSYGNKLDVTAWGSYLLTDWLSSSVRVLFTSLGEVDGMDDDIVAPVQTANPDFLGGNRVDAMIGLNAIGQNGFIQNQRLAIEFGMPVLQDLNGPQLKTTSTLTVGWQYAF